jgi:hypothetical protein
VNIRLFVVCQGKEKRKRVKLDALTLLYVSSLIMFILFDSTSFIALVVLEKIEYNRLNDKSKQNKYPYIIIDNNMWFISRCISIDSLNSCFQQQKNKMSYDFCLCREGSSIFEKR